MDLPHLALLPGQRTRRNMPSRISCQQKSEWLDFLPPEIPLILFLAASGTPLTPFSPTDPADALADNRAPPTDSTQF